MLSCLLCLINYLVLTVLLRSYRYQQYNRIIVCIDPFKFVVPEFLRNFNFELRSKLRDFRFAKIAFLAPRASALACSALRAILVPRPYKPREIPRFHQNPENATFACTTRQNPNFGHFRRERVFFKFWCFSGNTKIQLRISLRERILNTRGKRHCILRDFRKTFGESEIPNSRSPKS